MLLFLVIVFLILYLYRISTTSLAIGVQAELSDGLDINNNSYSDLTHANSLVNCTNASVGNNTYSNSPLMLNSIPIL